MTRLVPAFLVANLITGNWIRDVYRLKRPGGAAAVVRPRISVESYFRTPPYEGRRERLWPEKLLAQYSHCRSACAVLAAALFFVDRRKLIADKLAWLRQQGIPDEPIARI